MQTVVENWELAALAATLAAALLGLTRWGKANAEALARVVEAIEAAGRALQGGKQLKEIVAANEPDFSKPARVALRDTVAAADPKQKTRPKWLRVARVVGAAVVKLGPGLR